VHKPLKALLICVALLVGFALLARLGLPEAVFTVVAAVLMVAVAVAVEWPRWRRPGRERWPNKLGQL